MIRVLVFIVIQVILWPHWACLAQEFRYRLPNGGKDLEAAKTVVGNLQVHLIKEGETLLDIARDYGLGFNEIEDLYPNIDPWVPKAGSEILLPTRWIIPLDHKHDIVVNVAEMRLYHFMRNRQIVATYPVGIGDLGSETPEGTFKIVQKRKDPTWYVPKSLWEYTEERVVPPGPDNPLGRYWLGLSKEGYGIHGTNFPWAIGRLVTLGCIRLYPEHIQKLYNEIHIGTSGILIYEPAKIGFDNGYIYLEVHSDRYQKKRDLFMDTMKKFITLGIQDYVDKEKIKELISHPDGVPRVVGHLKGGRMGKGGDSRS